MRKCEEGRYKIGRNALMRGIVICIAAVIICSLAIPGLLAQDTGAAVEVRVTPESEHVEEGATFSVTIDVDDVTDLKTGQFDLSFDSSVLELIDVEDGSVGGETLPIVIENLVDAGTVCVVCVVSEGTASGSGHLAKISFKVIGAEGKTSRLDISNGDLSDNGTIWFYIDEKFRDVFNGREIPDEVEENLKSRGRILEDPTVDVIEKDKKWKITDKRVYMVIARDSKLRIQDTGEIFTNWVDAEISVGGADDEEEEGEEGYNVTPCDAIDISIGNATVTDFLNATNMTTVHVYNFKGYKGENTWMVQWSSSNRLLDVYVNVATGEIVGIEKITVPEALKAWIVANYGDGTRVTSEGWRKLNIAVMLNTLAPLPVGYTKADITEEVVIWAMDNPDWTIPTPTPTPTPTLTPTPTAETKTWHSVITFTDRDHKESEPFTIKGDVWRINYTVNPVEEKTDHSIFSVHVYPENETIVSVSSWKCWFECCNGTEYIYEGNADYYIEVIASSNSWKLEVEDYY